MIIQDKQTYLEQGLAAARGAARDLARCDDAVVRSVLSDLAERALASIDSILAANAVLMHFVSVCAYFLDGFAFAAEALVGKAVGAAHRAGLSKASRMTTWWAAWVALFSSLLLIVFGPSLVNILTVEPDVRALAREFLPWAALAPLAGVWCFQLDGIFIGATRTAAMRNAMLMSLTIFLIAWFLLTPFGNNGLWAALYVHYAARTGTLLYFFPALQRSVPV